MIIAISSVSLAAVLGFGIYHSNAAQAEPGLSKEEIRALVEEQYPGTITELELDKGFNRAVYEVEVTSNGKEYEIELDGNTGEVLKLQEKEKRVADNDSTVNDSNKVSIKEKNDDAEDTNTSNDDKNNVDDKAEDTSNQSQKDVKDEKDEGNQSKEDNTKNVVIDVEAAKKIALGEFPGTITDLELDEDDGRLIYEIEIESADGEVELEIDAYTGEIIYISIDSEIGTSNGENSNGDSDDQSDDLEDDEDWDDDNN
jgi:uncharacterized membrane protein YkoI